MLNRTVAIIICTLLTIAYFVVVFVYYWYKMKKKQFQHPCIYLNILDKNNSVVLVEYKNNEFDEFGNRIIKVCKIELSESFNNLANDFSQILNKLNEGELIKINNYLKTQYKVLKYHKKNNNYDSVRVVNESIELVESFKKELIAYGFWMADIALVDGKFELDYSLSVYKYYYSFFVSYPFRLRFIW